MPRFYGYYSASKGAFYGDKRCSAIAYARWNKLGLNVEPTTADGASVWVNESGKLVLTIICRNIFSPHRAMVATHREECDMGPETTND